MKNILLCFALVFSVSVARSEDKQPPLIVHEWGTFTSLQDEQGNAIGGINTDDEPVPAFVHRLGFNLITPQRTNLSLAPSMYASKIAAVTTHCDPEVLVRLETPVIYFYPPAGWKPQAVDVHVAFPGGWLSEFYPQAVSKAPGFHPNGETPVGHLTKNTFGELSWSGLVLGSQEGATPQTTDKVWLAPRDVKSSYVTASNGESEKFLFYRGVGHIEASLRIVRNTGGDLEVSDNQAMLAAANLQDAPRIRAAWLVDILPDGACAFKSLGPVEPATGIRATMPGSFTDKEFSADNMAALRGQMRTALIHEGLFPDEAEAMLNTWELSYFKSPGLRFFYLCPRVQIDAALPLDFSVPARVSRVMIGRIEIVTPAQRAFLKEIASGASGKKLGQDYLNLGRFRNALVLDEQKRRSTTALDNFINQNSLGAYIVAPEKEQAGISSKGFLSLQPPR
jgi:hypothetical protein